MSVRFSKPIILFYISQKFQLSVIGLKVVSSVDHIILIYLFTQGLKVNHTVYIKVVVTMLKPWIKWVTIYVLTRLCSLLGVLCDSGLAVQEFSQLCHACLCSPLYYSYWDGIKKETNQQPHNIKDFLSMVLS